ncbi:MAG: hypothetical protein HOE90_07215 [Bacteriovoracaceae bacterium]|jgi:HD-GYP domain-containing protein (c-di-GMP phosphodiesterase class II)|nr:hypothetical protein [Bacteriovoracaceae bacterium]
MTNIHTKVIEIIEQHHENHNGGGFPKKLGFDEISPWAQIVSMANIYDKQVTNNAHLPTKKHQLAVKKLEYDRGMEAMKSSIGQITRVNFV